MRTATLLLMTLLGSSVSLVGCDGGDEKEDAKKGAAKGDAAKGDAAKGDAAKGDAAKEEAPAEAGPLELPKTGLKGTAPAGSNVSEMMGSDMVQGPDLVATVSNVEGEAITLEKAKEDAEMYGPKGMKEETLDDGFVLSFTNEGAAGTNYWVKVYRTFDDKQVECSTTAHSEAQQAGAITFCKSLSK